MQDKYKVTITDFIKKIFFSQTLVSSFFPQGEKMETWAVSKMAENGSETEFIPNPKPLLWFLLHW